MLENYKKENIGPAKYTFRLGELFKHKKIGIVDLEKEKVPELQELTFPYILKPGELVIGRTIEKFNTPLDVMSLYAASSTSIRIGLQVMVGGFNDPGYKGNAVMSIKNVSQNKIKLFKGMELMHTAFITLKGTAIPVQTKYMGGKVL